MFKKMFAKIEASDKYAQDSMQYSVLEYYKALDAVDYANAMAEYHRKRIDRYKEYDKTKNNNSGNATDVGEQSAFRSPPGIVSITTETSTMPS